jgi:hypothetical protein
MQNITLMRGGERAGERGFACAIFNADEPSFFSGDPVLKRPWRKLKKPRLLNGGSNFGGDQGRLDVELERQLGGHGQRHVDSLCLRGNAIGISNFRFQEPIAKVEKARIF